MHLILFDIDGTLMRGPGVGTRALKLAFADVFGVETLENPALKDVFIAGSTDPVILRDMARALDLDMEGFESRKAALVEIYLGHLRRTIAESETKRACPGVVGLLERLTGTPKILLGLLTGNLEPAARIKLEPFGLNRFFEFGGFGGDGPDRAAQAVHALDRAQTVLGRAIPPENVLVVGDTENDVEAGRAHGFHTVGVGTGWHPMERLREAGASAVFETLEPQHGFQAWLEDLWKLKS
jgi:phosphoglycolate phosphatase-like HAD superfamily hydrolase